MILLLLLCTKEENKRKHEKDASEKLTKQSDTFAVSSVLKAPGRSSRTPFFGRSRAVEQRGLASGWNDLRV
jgi:hypothetical protein